MDRPFTAKGLSIDEFRWAVAISLGDERCWAMVAQPVGRRPGPEENDTSRAPETLGGIRGGSRVTVVGFERLV